MTGQDSKQVIVPGTGRFFNAATDTQPPGWVVAITGSPTGTSFTFTIAGGTSAAIPYQATAAQFAAALAAITGVGTGKAWVFPISTAATGYSWLVMVDPTVTPGTVSVTGTLTGGSTPTITSTPFGGGIWTPWSEIGHTSEDSPLQINRNGGDVTTLDSWQAKAIDSSTAPVTWALAFDLLQYDYVNQKLYYGSNAVVGTNGMLQAASTPSGTEEALLVLVSSGSKALVRHYPRGSYLAADGENFDTSKLGAMPLAYTVLQSNTYVYPFQQTQVGAIA